MDGRARHSSVNCRRKFNIAISVLLRFRLHALLRCAVEGTVYNSWRGQTGRVREGTRLN